MPKHGDQEGRLREDFHANPIWESDEERKKRNESEIIVPVMKVIIECKKLKKSVLPVHFKDGTIFDHKVIQVGSRM